MPASDYAAEVIFADVIRRENTGKYILVGGYAADLLLPPMPPQSVPLQALVQLRGPLGRPLPFLSVEIRMDAVTLSAFQFNTDASDPNAVPLPPELAALSDRVTELGAGHAMIAAQIEVGFVIPPGQGDTCITAWVDVGHGPKPAGGLLVRRPSPPEPTKVADAAAAG